MKLRSVLLALLLFLGAAPTWAGIKKADVDATGPDFTKQMTCFHIQGQLAADVASKVKFKAPVTMQLLNVYIVARARAGAASDATFDVLDDAVSVLSAKCAADVAGTIYDCDLVGSTLPVTILSASTITCDWDRNNSGTADDVDICLVWRSLVAAE